MSLELDRINISKLLLKIREDLTAVINENLNLKINEEIILNYLKDILFKIDNTANLDEFKINLTLEDNSYIISPLNLYSFLILAGKYTKYDIVKDRDYIENDYATFSFKNNAGYIIPHTKLENITLNLTIND